MTRPAHQADELCALIELNGWNAIRFPTLEIAAINNEKINRQLETLGQSDWLIFISANAVNFALSANNGKIDCFKKSSIAAVGKATEKALQAAGLTVDLLPDNQFNTEGLLATNEMNQVKGKGCMIIRGLGGREMLANKLYERGAEVEYMEVYSREMPMADSVIMTAHLKQGTLHALTITSGEALKNLMMMVESGLRDKLLAVPLIVISNRLKELAEKSGFKTIAITEGTGDAAIIKTVGMISQRAQQQTNGG